MFAGGGVKGGQGHRSPQTTGAATRWNTAGRATVTSARKTWRATIYSALGIDWTTVRYDDPFHRGFEYVPFSGQDLYGPIDELWG